jgi:DNA modification methylase
MEQMNIRLIPAANLNPAKYNPRKDLKPGDPEYEKLLRSVKEFGYVEPVIWNERTGNIVGGHQRFKVLKQLGYTEIQCVVVDLSEQREKALNVALNKIGGEFEMELLHDLLYDLQDEDIDVTLTGFDLSEMEKIFQQQAKKGQADEDDFDADAEAEKIVTPVTQPGDIWLVGRHRLMCGDSTDPKQMARLMDGKRARMIFTDPPWNVDYGGHAHPSWKQRSIMNDKMTREDFFEFLTDAAKSMASACEPGALTYLVMSAQEWGNLMSAMQRAGFHWSSTIIWYKDRFVLSRKDYMTQYEPIWYGWLSHPTKSADFAGAPGTGARRLIELHDRTQSDVWEIPRPLKSDEHPTMKPIALVARALKNSSRYGDIVLDAFGGSGTTLIACEQADRLCRAMELDPKYCDVILKRFCLNHPADSVFLLRGREKITYSEAQSRSDFVEIATEETGDLPF